MRQSRLSLPLLLVLAACSQTPPPAPAPDPADPTAEAPPPPGPAPVADSESWNWRCGDQDVVFVRTGDGYTLAIAGESIAMQAVEAASGNKHVGVDDPATVFWSKGDEAFFERTGQPQLDCVAVEVDAAGGIGGVSGAEDTDAAVDPDDAGADALPAAEEWIGIDWTIGEAGGRQLDVGTGATVRFDAGGAVAGSAGCNRYTGGYTLVDGIVAISPLAVTRMACPPAQMELESDVLAVLSGDVAVSLRDDGSLELDGPGGRLVATR